MVFNLFQLVIGSSSFLILLPCLGKLLHRGVVLRDVILIFGKDILIELGYFHFLPFPRFLSHNVERGCINAYGGRIKCLWLIVLVIGRFQLLLGIKSFLFHLYEGIDVILTLAANLLQLFFMVEFHLGFLFLKAFIHGIYPGLGHFILQIFLLADAVCGILLFEFG